jgi:flavorubredoxin
MAPSRWGTRSYGNRRVSKIVGALKMISSQSKRKTMKTAQTNFNEAIAIFDDIYWVGFYDSGSGLHCNPYLLINEEDVVLFDPGSIPHFPEIMTKVIDVVSPQDITAIVVHHQDPDVCGNTAIVEDTLNRSNWSCNYFQ